MSLADCLDVSGVTANHSHHIATVVAVAATAAVAVAASAPQWSTRVYRVNQMTLTLLIPLTAANRVHSIAIVTTSFN